MDISAICPCGHADEMHDPHGCHGGRFRPCPCATARAGNGLVEPAESHTIVPADWAFRHGGGDHIRVR
jgi:hypothetical protein